MLCNEDPLGKTRFTHDGLKLKNPKKRGLAVIFGSKATGTTRGTVKDVSYAFLSRHYESCSL